MNTQSNIIVLLSVVGFNMAVVNYVTIAIFFLIREILLNISMISLRDVYTKIIITVITK